MEAAANPALTPTAHPLELPLGSYPPPYVEIHGPPLGVQPLGISLLYMAFIWDMLALPMTTVSRDSMMSPTDKTSSQDIIDQIRVGVDGRVL